MGCWRVELEAALEIRVLHRHGQGIREIARETGFSATGAALSAPRGGDARCKASPVRAAKLDPFKSHVITRLRAGPSLSRALPLQPVLLLVCGAAVGVGSSKNVRPIRVA